MRLVITGATGNLGTALLRLLRDQPEVDWVRAVVASKVPQPIPPYDRAGWSVYDLGVADNLRPLAELMRGATAVVHLAWDILGTGGRPAQRRSNLAGSRHVLAASLLAGVPQLVHASSVAAYAPEPSHRIRVAEDWPLTGLPSSAYSYDKVKVERLLERAAKNHPQLRVAVLRPPSVLQPAAATELSNYLLGRLAPLVRHPLLRPRLLPLPRGLTTQAVHAKDVADLLWRVIQAGATGAYNVATEPVLDTAGVATALRAVPVPVPALALRSAMALTAAVRLQPLDGSWLDLLTRAPLVDTDRARRELGWRPQYGAGEVLAAVRDAAIAGTGTGSPRLAPA